MADPIKPVYSRYDRTTGQYMWGLGPDDYERIRQGYGCPRCLEAFEFYTARCPVCRAEIALEREIFSEPPPYWKPSPEEQDVKPNKTFDDAVKAFGRKS
jgi:hypothetical protein